jgi:hypothetical protein
MFASAIISELLPQFSGTFAEDWLNEVSRQARREYRRWSERYIVEPTLILNTIKEVSEALNNLSQEEKLIPVAEFSKKITGSSCAFDFHEQHGQLFLKALSLKFNLPAPTNTEDCICLHLRAGLLSCGKISGVTVHGFSSETQMLTLEQLNCMESVSAHGGKVFIVEDPLVFNALCEQAKDLQCTIINSSAGRSAAFMYLMKKFFIAKIPMYYAGNMTYNGLEAADKLCVQFKKGFFPWRYAREDYELILSNDSSPLQTEKKFLSLHNETLASLLSVMRKTGKTASSMPLLSRYIEDIKVMVH